MADTIVSKSATETEKIGGKLARELSPGNVIALTGDLGGGKTTFTKGLARGLGISEPITSPTFMLERVFATEGQPEIKYLRHYDAYRLENGKELADIGFLDAVEGGDSVAVVEWADRVKEVLPASTIWVNFSFVDDNTRQLEINKPVRK